MLIRLKFVLFDWGTFLAVLLLVGAAAMLVRRPTMFAAAGVPGVGMFLGIIYFVQKQKLEETRLFKELFIEFNRRYDELNDELAAVCERSGPLSADEWATFVNYLNLCSEEYLFYKRGYIHPSAWRTWRNGLRDVVSRLSRRSIASELRNELEADMYYGLDKVLIAEPLFTSSTAATVGVSVAAREDDHGLRYRN